MIFGHGIDIAKVSRFEKWVKNDKIIRRFFNQNECELFTGNNLQHLCEHYAARFAAKEAFVKALGTGFTGIELKDVYVCKNESGKPCMVVAGEMVEHVKKIVGVNFNIHLSLSHEAEYAVASVIIEKM